MTKEEAIERVRTRFDKWALDEGDLTALQALGLATKESEDERIRKVLCDIVRDMPYMETELRAHGLTVEKTLAYLERQKPAEWSALQKAFISSKIDYTLEEKCDASDYADAILPTSVPYGENEEEYKLHKIIEAAFIAGQKKEQKPTEWRDTDMNEARNNLISVCRDWERGEHTTLLPVAAVHARYFLEHLTEPKPAEWSEEDKRNLYNTIEAIKYVYDVSEGSGGSRLIAWLKFHLRPQSHWKPSEKQMGALNYAYCELFKRKDVGHNILGPLQKLIDELQKLL